jgi:hypothetical protein
VKPLREALSSHGKRSGYRAKAKGGEEAATAPGCAVGSAEPVQAIVSNFSFKEIWYGVLSKVWNSEL